MRRWAILPILAVFAAHLAAEPDFWGLRAGFLAPADAKTGFMFGAYEGWTIDNAVQLHLAGDFYMKNYSKVKNIGYQTDVANNPVTTRQKTSDISTYYLPLTFNLRVGIPAQSAITPYVGAGLGWGLLWEDVYVAADTEHKKVDTVKFYNGFNANLAAGARLPLGERSTLTGEVFYNIGAMKRNIEETDTGITWDEISMNGIGLRLGVEFGR
jgi:outer membrane protein W